MSLFNLFSNKKKQVPEVEVDFSKIVVDFHSHLIPNVDDGVKSVEETFKALRGFKEMGYQKVITTPHIMDTGYTNTSGDLKNRLVEIKAISEFQEIGIDYEVSAEYNLDEGFEQLLEKEDFLTFGNKNILVETSMQHDFEFVRDYIFELNKKGYKPILAHPERYRYIINEKNYIDKFENWKASGLLFQLNMFSLIGIYGSTVKSVAEQLVDANLYDFVGSDMHQAEQLNLFQVAKNNVFLNQLIESKHLKNKNLL